VIDALGEAWAAVEAGDRPSPAQEAALYLAGEQAMEAAVDAVDTAFTFAEASVVYDDHPLRRCFRDLRTARQHIAFNPDNFGSFARSRFDQAVSRI
jgi:hypothetical protein